MTIFRIMRALYGAFWKNLAPKSFLKKNQNSYSSLSFHAIVMIFSHKILVTNPKSVTEPEFGFFQFLSLYGVGLDPNLTKKWGFDPSAAKKSKI